MDSVKARIYELRPTKMNLRLPDLPAAIPTFDELDEFDWQIRRLTDEAQESHLSEDPEGRP